jgi:hypothetical protein
VDLFGHVGRVLGYTVTSQVILHVHGEEDRKFLSFADAAPLNMGGAWPLLTMGHPYSESRVFMATGGYAGVMGRVGSVESRWSTMVVLLEVMK